MPECTVGLFTTVLSESHEQRIERWCCEINGQLQLFCSVKLLCAWHHMCDVLLMETLCGMQLYVKSYIAPLKPSVPNKWGLWNQTQAPQDVQMMDISQKISWDLYSKAKDWFLRVCVTEASPLSSILLSLSSLCLCPPHKTTQLLIKA